MILQGSDSFLLVFSIIRSVTERRRGWQAVPSWLITQQCPGSPSSLPRICTEGSIIQARVPQHHPTCRIIVFESLDSHTDESPGNRGSLQYIDETLSTMQYTNRKSMSSESQDPKCVFFSFGQMQANILLRRSARPYRTILIRSTSMSIYFLRKCPCVVAISILGLIRE